MYVRTTHTAQFGLPLASRAPLARKQRFARSCSPPGTLLSYATSLLSLFDRSIPFKPLNGWMPNSPCWFLDSDGSRKEEEPFLDPLSKDVSKLD